MNTISIRNGKTNLRAAMLILTFAQYNREVDAIAGEAYKIPHDDYVNSSYETLERRNATKALLHRLFPTTLHGVKL